MTKTRFITQNLIIAVVLFCCVSESWASERRTEWLLRDGEQVWCTTPGGLARFNLTTQVWESIVIPGVIDKESVREIRVDGDLIWLLTDNSVIQSNANRTQWIAYRPEEGIPSGRPAGLVFEEDYVYLATTAGPARFDRTIEEWEILRNDAVQFGESAQVAQMGNYVWFSSKGGLLRYDPTVRGWQTFTTQDGLLMNSHYWLEERSEELWAIGDNGVDIYQAEGRNWLQFAPTIDQKFPDIMDIEVDGDILWVLTDKGIRWWNWREKSDRPFPKEVRFLGKTITDVEVEGSKVSFAAEDMVMVLSRQSGGEEWTYLDESRGIPNMAYQRVEMVNDLLFLMADNRIVVYSLEAGEVVGEYAFEQQIQSAKDGSQFGTRISEQGLEIRGWGQPLWYFKGTSTGFGLRNPGEEWEWWQRTSMSAIRSFPGNRHLTLSYDNTDQERIRWGGVYRGARNDNLRLLEGGNRVPVDMGGSRLLGTTGVKGGAVRMESGSRSDTRGWRQVALSGWGGIQQEANAHEVFSGQGDVLYFLEHQNLVIGSARVWLDGNELSPSDFVLDHSSGTLSFLFPGRDLVDENSLIEVRYRYNLEGGEGTNLGAATVEWAVTDHFRSGFSAMESEDGRRTGELSGEVYIPVPNGEIHMAPEVAVQLDSAEESSRSGYIDVAGRVGTVKVEGSWMGIDTAFQSLAVENSEFGALHERGKAETRWEPRPWLGLGGQVSRELATIGREDEWGGSVSASPPGYPSAFASVRRTDAWADTMTRHRDFLNGGIRMQLGNQTRPVGMGLTQIDLDLRSGWTGVSWRNPESQPVGIEQNQRTSQIWFRGRLTSGTKVSVQPEYYWKRKEVRGVENVQFVQGNPPFIPPYNSRGEENSPSEWQPEEKRNRLRTSVYLIDLPTGLSTTFRLEGDLHQPDYLPDLDAWNAYLIRKGEISTEVIPGIWWKALNPFSVGLSATVDRRDSLVRLPNEVSWIDVIQATDSSKWNQQTVSGRGEITYRPDPRWLITQVLSVTDIQEVQQQQQSSSKMEWSPRGTTRWIFQYQWTGEDYLTTYGSDLVIHRPSVEWHQRWGGPWFTRCTLSGQIYDQAVTGYQEGSLRTYISAIWRELPHWGNVEGREEVTFSIRKYEVDDRQAQEIVNSLRGDWKPIGEVFFRAEWRVNYSWDDLGKSIGHRVEVRMGVRF